MTAARGGAATTPATCESSLSAWTRATVAFIAFALAAAVLLWPTLARMAATWVSSSAYHHGVFVAPIALWMIVRQDRAHLGAPAFPPRPSYGFLAGVLAAALVWLAGRAAGVNLVAEFGFVSLLIAGAGVAFGAPSVRHWAFPLAFLYFMVPFGGALLPGLQSFAAHGVAALLSASGVETTVSGALIATPIERYLIAEACAGLNFLLAASMVAAIYSFMSFQRWTKMAAFLAFAVLFALTANVLRAYVVILLDTWTGGELGIAENHILFGWAFYGALLLILVIIGNRFSDAPVMSSSWRRGAQSHPGALQNRGGAAIFFAFAILVATAGYARFVVERPPAIALPTSLPLISAPGWRVVDPAPDWRASIERADRTLFAGYQRESSSVELAAAYFAYDRPQAEIASFATRAFDGRDWRRLGARQADVLAFGSPRAVRIETLENAAGQRLDAVTLYWLGGDIFADPLSLKLRQAGEKLAGRNRRGGALIIAAPAGDGAEGERAIRAFFQDVEPFDRWLARIDAKLSN